MRIGQFTFLFCLFGALAWELVWPIFQKSKILFGGYFTSHDTEPKFTSFKEAQESIPRYRFGNRVQWFWHFFRNSICFMCFWFGLEIPRLFYKKAFLEMLNGFYLIWPFIRVGKKFLRNRAYRVSKEAEFCSDFKNVLKSRVWQKGKKFLQKNWIFRDFLRKNLWELLAQEFYTFLKSAQNSASFDTLCAQFWRNFFQLL